MEGTPAIYLGRIVDKKHFRAFIYGANGEQRLVESWEEFEANMQSGVWFATVEDAEASKAAVKEDEGIIECGESETFKEKPKAKPRAKPKPKAKPQTVEQVEDSEDVLPDDGSVFEVTDDFLPKEGE